jgi:hypothetical protein
MALALGGQHAWAKTARGMLLKGEFRGAFSSTYPTTISSFNSSYHFAAIPCVS